MPPARGDGGCDTRGDRSVTSLDAARRASTEARGRPAGERDDGLFVHSVEKAFRVLGAFGDGPRSLGLSEIATAAGLDRSAAQRFAHTLEKLGFLRKDPRTRHYALTVRTLELGARYIRASALVDRALPYLLDLSRATEEAVSLTVLDGTEIVYVSRLLSRHMLNTNVILGSRLPAYCTAPGIAMLAALPRAEARAILRASDRRAYTGSTTTAMPDLLARLDETARRGFALACEEIYPGDISIAATVTGGDGGERLAAVNVAVSRARLTPEAAVERYAPLVVGAAAAISRSPPGGGSR
jgi:DNA-binding IclR family transcriptional regulator